MKAKVSGLIALMFLWTGSSYLTWYYNLANFFTPSATDMLSEVIGYLFQVIGLIIFAVLLCKIKSFEQSRLKYYIEIALVDFLFIVLAATAPSGLLALIFGYGMNLFHGMIAGIYLLYLSRCVPTQNRGLVFGIGYGVGSIGSWIISLIGSGNFLKEKQVLIIYLILLVASILLLYFIKPEDTSDSPVEIDKKLIILAAFTIVFLSLVKNLGFYFPMADLSEADISLEFSRTFYALGLIVAGFINDRSRKWGSICCVTALVFPFVLLTLQAYATTSYVIWILGYVFFGFFAVYRVLVFSDMAGKGNTVLFLSGLGLMFGRIGDASGAFIGATVGKNAYALITSTFSLFVVTIILFFNYYNKVYIQTVIIRESAKETRQEADAQRLSAFIERYEFTDREKDVLKLILSGCNNSNIAEKLYISENTVKFHIKNILKKTSCANRTSLTEKIRGE